jgi:hypothetical protein
MKRLCVRRNTLTFDEAMKSLGRYDQLYELYEGTIVIERREEDGSVRKKEMVKLCQEN